MMSIIMKRLKRFFTRLFPTNKKNLPYTRSLSKITNQELRSSYPFLYADGLKFDGIAKYLAGWGSWWIYLIMTLVFVFGIPLLTNTLQILRVMPINDNDLIRGFGYYIGSMFALFAILLTLVGFGASNIPHKTGVSYRILLRKAGIVPLIFILGSTILCTVLYHLLYDIFDISMRVVILIYILYILIALVCWSVYAFIQIVKFLSIENLIDQIRKLYYKESIKNLKKTIIAYLSGNKYADILKAHGISQSMYESGQVFVVKARKTFTKMYEYRLSDVNLRKLLKWIMKIEDKVVKFKSISLGDDLSREAIFVAISEDLGEKDKSQLSKSYKLKKCVPYKEDQSVYHDCNEIMKTAIRTDNSILFRNILSVYEDTIIKILVKVSRDSETLDHIIRLYYLRPLSRSFLFALDNANKQMANELIRSHFSTISSTESSMVCFNATLGETAVLYSDSIWKLEENKIPANYHEQLTFTIMSGHKYLLMELIEILINHEDLKLLEATSSKIESLIKNILKIEYLMTRNKDFSNLIQTQDYYDMLDFRFDRLNEDKLLTDYGENVGIDNGNQIRINKIKNRIWEFYIQSIAVLRFWCYFLLNLDIIDDETIKEIVIAQKSYIIHPFNINDIIRLYYKSSTRQFPVIDGWDFKERKAFRGYTPTASDLWIMRGFIIDLLKNNEYNLSKIDTSIAYSDVFIDRCMTSLEAIKKDQKYIVKIFGSESERVLELIDKNIEILKNQKEMQDKHKLEAIIEKGLSTSIVQGFKDKSLNSWKEYSLVRMIVGLYDVSVDSRTKLDKIGWDVIIKGGKERYQENDQDGIVYMDSDHGYQLAKIEVKYFLSKLIDKAKYKYDYISVIDALDYAIDKLKSSHNDVVIIAGYDVVFDARLHESEAFQFERPNSPYSIRDDDGNPIYHKYRGYPLYSSHSIQRNQLIVFDVKNSIRLHIHEDSSLLDDRLHIEIIPFDEEAAKKELENNPQRWTDNKGNVLDPEAALLQIQTSVRMELWLQEKIEVIDSSKVYLFNINDNDSNAPTS